MDAFDKDVIRREILRLIDMKQLVTCTMRKLKHWLKEHNIIDIAKSTLWKTVRQIGFTFRKTASGKNVLCEKPHLACARSNLLSEIKTRRDQGYDIVYLDEAWISAHHKASKE